MRLLYFTLDDSPHDFRFITSLAKTEHEVFVLRLERKGPLKEDRHLPENVKSITWKGGTQPFQFRQTLPLLKDLCRVIKEVQPDIIHAGPVQKPAFLAALSGFRPLVVMSWGSDILVDTHRNLLWNWITRFTLSRASLLLGDCEAVKNKAVSLGFDAQRVVLFPWGIDLESFSSGAPGELIQQLGWSDQCVFLSLRNWEPIYGVDLLVKAFAAACKQNNRIRLLMLGGGSMEKVIREIIQHEGIVDKIHLAGRVSQADLPVYYHSSQVYVSASHSDGSSVSLMEALGCGLPVLVSDIPGNREWITPGEQGWLFKDGSIDELTDSFLTAFNQRRDFDRLGKNARKLALERADWRKNFNVLLDAYRKALLLEGNIKDA